MDYKKEIVKLLDFLKSKGHDRASIEKKLGYANNAIDQSLARDGSKKLLMALRLYKEWVLKNSIPTENSEFQVNEDSRNYGENQSFWKTKLSEVLEINRDLSIGVKDIGAAVKDIAHSNAQAMELLKYKTIGDAASGMTADIDRRFSDLYMRLAEIGVGKRWATIEEAVAELNKSVVSP